MNTLLNLKRIILSGGAEEASYLKIQGEIQKSNRTIVKGFSFLAFVTLAVLFTVSLFVESLSGYSVFYGVSFAVSLAIWMIANFPGKTSNTLMLVDMYLFAASLFGIGIVLGTFLSPKEISATFIALLLAAPQLLTDRPWRMYILIVTSVAVFIVIAIIVKDPMTWNSDITNAVLFGIISMILCTYSISTRVSRYCLQEKIRFMAENDQLTGLRNRNSYQQSLEKATVLQSSALYCVYVDVNGLHELNNTKGHEAGDRMLQYIASAMQHLFGEKDTYRIGGDEFVAIGINKNKDEIRNLAEQLKQAVESAGYHVAIGICHREKCRIDVDSIVKEAEKEMYEDKADYYRKSGIDRRRR